MDRCVSLLIISRFYIFVALKNVNGLENIHLFIINQVYIKSILSYVCLNFLALCTWNILWTFLIKAYRQLRYLIVSCIWAGRERGGEDVKLEGKKLMKLWRTNGGKKTLRGLEQKKRRRWGGLGEEEEDKRLSPQPAGWGEKEWRERERRRRRGGRSKKSWRDCECVWGLSEAFINESRCLALWTCRVADGDGGDGALDSPDGYHSLSSSCLSTAFPSARRVSRRKREKLSGL